jgi:hypothetical protein
VNLSDFYGKYREWIKFGVTSTLVIGYAYLALNDYIRPPSITGFDPGGIVRKDEGEKMTKPKTYKDMEGLTDYIANLYNGDNNDIVFMGTMDVDADPPGVMFTRKEMIEMVEKPVSKLTDLEKAAIEADAAAFRLRRVHERI